jgi:SpoVK/Ycf46/Vps4 family AAA+-type ATPase
MSGISSVAQRVIDYALSEAKRNSAEYATEVHLLAAIRRWNEEVFEFRFPNSEVMLNTVLSLSKGNYTKVIGLSDSALEKCSALNSLDDVWNLATIIYENVAKLAGEEELVSKVSLPVEPSSKSIPPVDLSGLRMPFSLTGGLLARVTDVCGRKFEEVCDIVSSDALYVARKVMGQSSVDVVAEFKNAADFEFTDLAIDVLSGFIREVSLSSHPESKRVATQLAISLVEVGEWAAGIDENVTSDETDRIDEVRMEMRALLEDRIDAESEAMISFEQKFASLVGMKNVKTDLRKRVDYLVVSKRRAKRGKQTTNHRLHMAFMGNPGTGKTTVARLYGELMHELGLLPTKNFVETDRSGLVAQYVGQSEARTLEALNKADGGIFFIDEAYSLDDRYGDDRKGFGAEVTDCLVKQMEDRRERLMVILAGYTEPIKDFIGTNEGLKSRIPTFIEFADYSDDELLEIAILLSHKMNLIITDNTKSKLQVLLGVMRNDPGFGNARTVENILEAAERNLVNRTASLGALATELELRTVLVEDLPEVIKQQTKQIGFRPISSN